MAKILLFLALAFLMPIAHAGGPIEKVSVLSSGKLLLDGKPTDLKRIEEDFRKLKEAGGSVWYYREAADTEPPPEGPAVVQLIIKYRLPVSFSTKPDFSDYVDENGVPHPR